MGTCIMNAPNEEVNGNSNNNDEGTIPSGNTATDQISRPEVGQFRSSSGMPRLSNIISAWCSPPGYSDMSGNNHLVHGGRSGEPAIKEMVRTRTAPAGPHPYLDRFASGMHRPLEDNSTWRQASIQPVPIPDLGHTGIRTKFSPGPGDGFTPEGAMTETFRSGIYETIRNLPRGSLGDARDMKTRDYARAVRKHREGRGGLGGGLGGAGGVGGSSLLQSHMSSLELSPVPGTRGVSALGFPQKGSSVPQSSYLGVFRSRFSPPSSPFSAGRVVGRGGLGGGGSGGTDEAECGITPDEKRQALLRRELMSVKLAAAAACGGVGVGDIGVDEPSETKTFPDGEMMSRLASSRAGGAGGVRSAGSREMREGKCVVASNGRGVDVVMPKEEQPQRQSTGTSECRRDSSPSLRTSNERRGRGDGGDCERIGPRCGVGVGSGRQMFREEVACDIDALTEIGDQQRRRRRRRLPTKGAINATNIPTEDRGSALSTLNNKSSTTNHGRLPQSSSRTTTMTRYSRRTSNSTKRSSALSMRLKKPFSADSLFACLLDVSYGNTRDLSPTKSVGQGWDLQSLPAGIAAELSRSGAAGTVANTTTAAREDNSNGLWTSVRDSDDDGVEFGILCCRDGGVRTTGEGRENEFASAPAPTAHQNDDAWGGNGSRAGVGGSSVGGADGPCRQPVGLELERRDSQQEGVVVGARHGLRRRELPPNAVAVS